MVLASDIVLGALFIFVLRVLGVALATVRVLMMTRGYKLPSAAIGFVEVSVYALAIGPVVQNLSNLWYLFGYSLGFSVGTLVGLKLEERMALGYATVRIVSVERAKEIAEAIRKAGYGATQGFGYGANGVIGTVKAVVRRKEVGEIYEIANRVDPKAFVTVEETRWVSRGYMRIARHER
jgi:uncharacterized protein YebE (UPF0316 family)